MVHKILTFWDATCTTAATLLSLSLLAAAIVLSTSVLVEDSAAGDKAAMLMAALLVFFVVAVNTCGGIWGVANNVCGPIGGSGTSASVVVDCGIDGVAPGGVGGSGVLDGALSIDLVVVDGGIDSNSCSGVGGSSIVVDCVRPGGTFLFRSTGLLSITADGTEAIASHGGSIVCCWIWCRMVKVAQKGKDSGSWTLTKWAVPKFSFMGIRTSAKSSWELAFSLDLWIFLT